MLNFIAISSDNSFNARLAEMGISKVIAPFSTALSATLTAL
jgi:hypothetical protein